MSERVELPVVGFTLQHDTPRLLARFTLRLNAADLDAVHERFGPKPKPLSRDAILTIAAIARANRSANREMVAHGVRGRERAEQKRTHHSLAAAATARRSKPTADQRPKYARSEAKA